MQQCNWTRREPESNGRRSRDSIHTPGGGLMLFCDGSVRFLDENIDPKVLKALSTPDGGENVGAF